MKSLLPTGRRHPTKKTNKAKEKALRHSQVQQLQENIDKQKIKLMKKELLPKLLRKILSDKLQKKFKTLTFGLMTLKQDK